MNQNLNVINNSKIFNVSLSSDENEAIEHKYIKHNQNIAPQSRQKKGENTKLYFIYCRFSITNKWQ